MYSRLRQFNGNPIRNTRRVERVISIITYLSEYRTIKEMASLLKIHQKSVHRYLNLLVQLGFDVEVAYSGRYNLYKVSNVKEYFNVS